MLNTKTVKYLQSRPHHIKVMIFIFTMATAGVLGLSFLANSLSNNFIAADIKKADQENGVIEVADANNSANSPSILENLKANIYDFGSVVGSIFGSAPDKNKEVSIRKDDAKDRADLLRGIAKNPVETKKIQPVELPVDQQ